MQPTVDPPPPPREKRYPPAALRYFVALMFLFYGFAKLNGAQFTVLDSMLDRPMREVPGFWLTWYYFGYSAVYGTLIALLQVVGALMLTFRRTALLGACLLFGIVSNIVLVDLFYDVDVSGLASAVVLWICLAIILSTHAAELVRLFWTSQAPPPGSRSRGRRLGAAAVRVAMVLAAAGLTYWVANVNNRRPTAIDGTWEVVDVIGSAPVLPARIYFERNRAHMAVFRFADRWDTHHFEVDPARHGLRIWAKWLSKGPEVFSGTYRVAGDVLELDGNLERSPEPVHLRLRRVEAAQATGASAPPGAT
ncbi:MAG TPA: hypothetical protein VM890_00390 [Longimicrobium sp.]|jgi:hypothetical protein|nr:hypothetical protein [Longimicrobium sp.]